MPKLSQAQQQARRQQILDATFRCLANQGYSRMTIRDIASEADVSVGTLYLYFKDKHEMVSALREATDAAQDEKIQQNLRSQGGLETLSGMLDFLVRSLDDDENEETLRVDIQLWAEALQHDSLRKLIQAVFKEKTQQFSELIRVAQSDKTLLAGVEPEAVARLFLAIITGLELQRAIEPDFSCHSLLKPLGEILLRLHD